MKKMMALFLMVFLVVGILANSVLILADDNSGSSGDGGSNVPSVASGNHSGEQVRNALANQGESGDLKEQIQQRVQKEYEDHNGTHVDINREVARTGNITSVSVTRTITYANGTQANYTVQIQSGEDHQGKQIKNFSVEREGEQYNVSVQDGVNVSDNFDSQNHSYLSANMSDGRSVNISVLPDQALQRAREHLGVRNLGNSSNISLGQTLHNNVPQVVYIVEVNQQGKFLGVFKTAMKVNTEINPQTGNVVAVNKPWWSFLVSVPSFLKGFTNSTSNETTGNVTNSTNETSAPMIPVNGTTNTTSGNSTNSS